MKTISIITTSFNSASTIRDTLESVCRQDYPKKEHIIIDGGSTDGTLDIIAEYPHVSRVLSEKDNGIYDAMNKGIRLATGDVIGILNSDDFYTKEDVLSAVMNLLDKAAADACYADLQYINGSKVVRTWKSGPFEVRSFYYGWMPPHPTFFVRKKIYEKLGGFNLALKSAADYEFILRVCVKYTCKIAYLPRIIVKMRTGGMSNASLKNRLRANREDRKAWEINELKPFFFTTWLKPLRKLSQFRF